MNFGSFFSTTMSTTQEGTVSLRSTPSVSPPASRANSLPIRGDNPSWLIITAKLLQPQQKCQQQFRYVSNQRKKTADNTNSRESQKHQQEPRKKGQQQLQDKIRTGKKVTKDKK
jgi:hypothetical protein